MQARLQPHHPRVREFQPRVGAAQLRRREGGEPLRAFEEHHREEQHWLQYNHWLAEGAGASADSAKPEGPRGEEVRG
jgi:hypothetical protein